jgi:hypothetical protein
VGICNFAEGEGLVDEGFEVAGGDVVVDVLPRLGVLFGIRGYFKESVSPDGEELAECGEERVRSRFGGEGAVLEDDALGGRGRRFPRQSARQVRVRE